MSDFQTDFRWQAQFVPLAFDVIRKVRVPIGTFTEPLIAPREMDIKRNTDALLVSVGGKNIAMRIRRPGYFRRYGLDITIRSERRITGAETELSKLRRGLGDWFFYGHIEHGWSP
jgi:hypothetical protein